MKKIILLTIAATITSLSFAQKIQEKDIPAAIKSSFQKQFPAASEVNWEKEDNYYEAEFKFRENEYSALFDTTGSILETEIEISIDALPANVKDFITKNYSGQIIKEAAKSTDAKGTITYEAEIKNKDLIFDNNGKFIKEEKE